MKHSAEFAVRSHKTNRRIGLLFLAVLTAVLIGLAVLFANGLFFQVMFVPVIFGGVYAAACLCFEIWEDLSRKN